MGAMQLMVASFTSLILFALRIQPFLQEIHLLRSCLSLQTSAQKTQLHHLALALVSGEMFLDAPRL
jgi:hypothetical protein